MAIRREKKNLTAGGGRNNRTHVETEKTGKTGKANPKSPPLRSAHSKP
jgi:hypothetical protein